MGDKQALEREDGFSLAELMIVFVVLSLIVYAAFTILDSNVKAGSTFKMQSDLSQEMKTAMDTMSDQIRSARDFVSATDTDLTFTSYVTGTGTLYNVRFRLSSGQILYQVTLGGANYIPETAIANGVTSLDFDYISSAGGDLPNPGASLSSIYGVKITLTMAKTSMGITERLTSTTVVKVRR